MGRTARESIEHFIKKNSDKDSGYFKKKFDPVKDGLHERVVSREESKKDEDRYFTKFPVKLDNGEVVVISNDWGAGGPTYTRPWKQFKDRMDELGYSIIIDEESGE